MAIGRRNASKGSGRRILAPSVKRLNKRRGKNGFLGHQGSLASLQPLSQSVWQIVGYKNSGKTTLICSLIPLLQHSGRTVAVIKHDVHDFEMDHPGTDTYRHYKAGASAVAITNKKRTARIEMRETALPELIGAFADYEMVLVEGFKAERYSKIALVQHEEELELLSQLSELKAVAAPLSLIQKRSLWRMTEIPCFDLENAQSIADFILSGEIVPR